MSLEMDHYIEQGVTVITASGDINSATAHVFGGHITQVIDESDNAHIVLDMSGVYYMSSAGLRDIIAGLKQAKRKGGDLHIAGVQGRLKPVFEMVGLDSLSFFYDTVDEAVAGFQ